MPRPSDHVSSSLGSNFCTVIIFVLSLVLMGTCTTKKLYSNAFYTRREKVRFFMFLCDLFYAMCVVDARKMKEYEKQMKKDEVKLTSTFCQFVSSHVCMILD